MLHPHCLLTFPNWSLLLRLPLLSASRHPPVTMGPLVLVLMLLASSQLSQAALHISSSTQTSESDRIAVQAALQDLLHADSTHARRGVTVSTKGVVLHESGRVRDPGDAPVRITSKPVNEAGQARYKPSWSNAGPEDAITPDALEPHYVSAPSGQPIYVHKVSSWVLCGPLLRHHLVNLTHRLRCLDGLTASWREWSIFSHACWTGCIHAVTHALSATAHSFAGPNQAVTYCCYAAVITAATAAVAAAGTPTR